MLCLNVHASFMVGSGKYLYQTWNNGVVLLLILIYESELGVETMLEPLWNLRWTDCKYDYSRSEQHALSNFACQLHGLLWQKLH